MSSRAAPAQLGIVRTQIPARGLRCPLCADAGVVLVAIHAGRRRRAPVAGRRGEIDQLVAALREMGGRARRDELTKRVNAVQWGPGRFAAALREAIAEGRVRQVSHGQYARGTGQAAPTDEGR